eukprot:RCo054218
MSCSSVAPEWVKPSTTGPHPPMVESCSAVLLGDFLVVFGGYDENEPEEEEERVVLYRYHIPSESWAKLVTEEGVKVEGHSGFALSSTVMAVFGGMDQDYTFHNAVRSVDISMPEPLPWKSMTCTGDPSLPSPGL